MKNIIITFIIAVAFIICVCIILRNANEKDINNNNQYELLKQQYQDSITKYKTINKSLQDSIDSLNDVKHKVQIIYETIYKDFSNPAIVDDDSVTRYISKKIHNFQ